MTSGAPGLFPNKSRHITSLQPLPWHSHWGLLAKRKGGLKGLGGQGSVKKRTDCPSKSVCPLLHGLTCAQPPVLP